MAVDNRELQAEIPVISIESDEIDQYRNEVEEALNESGSALLETDSHTLTTNARILGYKIQLKYQTKMFRETFPWCFYPLNKLREPETLLPVKSYNIENGMYLEAESVFTELYEPDTI